MQETIAIFLCHCGHTLSNTIDFDTLKKKCKKLPSVAYVYTSSSLCLENECEKLLQIIRENHVRNVVIAACSPVKKGALFQKILIRTGFPPEHISFANIREQCAWTHNDDSTVKAFELILMAVQCARSSTDIRKNRRDNIKEVLVIGGGLCGMLAAREVTRLGLKATLVDTAKYPGEATGSLLNSLYLPDIDDLKKQIEENNAITIATETIVENIEGKPGEYTVELKNKGKIIKKEYGSIIIAKGEAPLTTPVVGEIKGPVVSSYEFEVLKKSSLLHLPSPFSQKPASLAFILDANGEGMSPSTSLALKQACELKKKNYEVFMFCKNLKVESEGLEALYREVRNSGVVIIKSDDKPVITKTGDGKVTVETYDVLSGEQVKLLCHYAVVHYPLTGHMINDGLSNQKLGVDSAGYYQDDTIHFYPVLSRRKGIFFAGPCRGNWEMSRVMSDISCAAINSYRILVSANREEEQWADTSEEKCRACLTCIRACPHSAIHLIPGKEKSIIASITTSSCDLCGICASMCPANAIDVYGYTDEQLLCQLDVLDENRLVLFCCAESAYKAADCAGELRLTTPLSLRIIPLPCLGRLETLHILRAFERKAKGVLVMGCPDGACKHIDGNIRAAEKVKQAQGMLEEMGMERERVKMVFCGLDMAETIVRETVCMDETLKELFV
jgi:heterodisulfide reductase subunit A-like polyferredoxin/coenzyme F420-reducing hydrogenase delta subunit